MALVVTDFHDNKLPIFDKKVRITRIKIHWRQDCGNTDSKLRGFQTQVRNKNQAQMTKQQAYLYIKKSQFIHYFVTN